MTSGEMAEFNSGEPLGYIDALSGGIKWDMVERVCHVTVQQRMSDELKSLIQRRLKSHSVAALMNTLTLMYAISINLEEHPELREQLADPGFFARFQKLVQVRDARISSAVMQLLVDWSHMFRGEALGKKASEVLSHSSLRARKQPPPTEVAARVQSGKRPSGFQRGVNFAERASSWAAPSDASTAPLPPFNRAEGPLRSASGPPPEDLARSSSSPPGPPLSSLPRAPSAASSDVSSVRSNAYSTTHSQRGGARRSEGQETPDVQARRVITDLALYTKHLQDATAAVLADLDAGNAAAARERLQEGEQDRGILESYRPDVRRLVTSPLGGGILENLLALNDKANTAITAWKRATSPLRSSRSSLPGPPGETSKRSTNAAQEATDGKPEAGTSGRGGSFWSSKDKGKKPSAADSPAKPGGSQKLFIAGISAPPWKGGEKKKSSSPPPASKTAPEAPAAPQTGLQTAASAGNTDGDRADRRSSGGSLASADLHFAQARVKTLEAENQKLKAHVAELEAKIARDLVIHRNAQKRIVELEEAAEQHAGSTAQASAERRADGHVAPSLPFSAQVQASRADLLLKQPSLRMSNRGHIAALLDTIASSAPSQVKS